VSAISEACVKNLNGLPSIKDLHKYFGMATHPYKIINKHFGMATHPYKIIKCKNA
jgi:hypothetical protein